jgi:hypothetical protein
MRIMYQLLDCSRNSATEQQSFLHGALVDLCIENPNKESKTSSTRIPPSHAASKAPSQAATLFLTGTKAIGKTTGSCQQRVPLPLDREI